MKNFTKKKQISNWYLRETDYRAFYTTEKGNENNDDRLITTS